MAHLTALGAERAQLVQVAESWVRAVLRVQVVVHPSQPVELRVDPLAWRVAWVALAVVHVPRRKVARDLVRQKGLVPKEVKEPQSGHQASWSQKKEKRRLLPRPKVCAVQPPVACAVLAQAREEAQVCPFLRP